MATELARELGRELELLARVVSASRQQHHRAGYYQRLRGAQKRLCEAHTCCGPLALSSTQGPEAAIASIERALHALPAPWMRLRHLLAQTFFMPFSLTCLAVLSRSASLLAQLHTMLLPRSAAVKRGAAPTFAASLPPLLLALARSNEPQLQSEAPSRRFGGADTASLAAAAAAAAADTTTSEAHLGVFLASADGASAVAPTGLLEADDADDDVGEPVDDVGEPVGEPVSWSLDVSGTSPLEGIKDDAELQPDAMHARRQAIAKQVGEVVGETSSGVDSSGVDESGAVSGAVLCDATESSEEDQERAEADEGNVAAVAAVPTICMEADSDAAVEAQEAREGRRRLPQRKGCQKRPRGYHQMLSAGSLLHAHLGALQGRRQL